jgi:hypothetical protein
MTWYDMNHFRRHFLFPKYKFLKDGRKEILQDKKNSFNSLCMRHLMILKGADKEDIWERVIVPSVMRKCQHMRCNLNNNIKLLCMSTTTLCKSTCSLLVNYTDIYFILCLNTTEERVVVWPDELGKGFQDYVKLEIEHVVYDFMCTYVRRMKPNTRWKKRSEKNAPQEKVWWEQEDEGYNSDSKVNTDFLWEEKTKRMIKERLGVVEEDTDDDSRIITGEELENY